MPDRSPASHGPRPGAADVVTGPVGSARLVGPGDDPEPGADRQELPGATMPNPVPEQDEDDQPGRREAPSRVADETAGD